MKLEQLHYLSEAVKYKSISVAAEENFISQPSLVPVLPNWRMNWASPLCGRNAAGVSSYQRPRACCVGKNRNYF